MLRTMRMAAICAASIIFFSTAPSMAAENMRVASLTTGQIADRVVVLKGDRRLVVMKGDRVLRIFRIALGRYPKGHKRREGDAKTPEGSYTLDYKLEDSAFFRAIHISYPNRRDLARAEAKGVSPGGKIMIHGLPNDMSAEDVGHPWIDWTQGCIAVTNREMKELWSMIRPGTPIEIHP